MRVIAICRQLACDTWFMADDKRILLRHFLAALAYRTQKALRAAPPEFSEFRAPLLVRTPYQLIRHMDDVLGYARTFFIGGTYRAPGSPVPPENFVFAAISPANLGVDQPLPVKPDKNWPERL